jgi:spore coat protein A, manganese oxidase
MRQRNLKRFRIASVLTVMSMIICAAAWQGKSMRTVSGQDKYPVPEGANPVAPPQGEVTDLRARILEARDNMSHANAAKLSGTLSPEDLTVVHGIATDFFVPEDYDGDRKTDPAIFRPGAPGTAKFSILKSSTGTVQDIIFGQAGDDPSVIGDYDGDGKADAAVYRAGASSGAPSFWIYRPSGGGPDVTVWWGMNGDFPAPGDYDGDGKMDFAIQRNGGGGSAVFFIHYSSGIPDAAFLFGTPTDVVVPGDYDGDGKTDIATVRGSAGQIAWSVRKSSDGSLLQVSWGASATDFPAQADYTGDGKTDFAVWRPNIDPTQCLFFVQSATLASNFSFNWGQNGDYPVANYNSH